MSRLHLEMSQVVCDAILSHLIQEKSQSRLAIALADDSYQAKALKDELEDLRSFRVARSRLILHVKRSTVEVVAFGPRKDIYE